MDIYLSISFVFIVFKENNSYLFTRKPTIIKLT